MYDYRDIAQTLIEQGGQGRAVYYDENNDVLVEADIYYSIDKTQFDYDSEPEYSIINFECYIHEHPNDLNADVLYDAIKEQLAA